VSDEPVAKRVDTALEEMSGDPAIARVVKASLQRLSAGAAGPELAEFARDVLDGRIDVRTAAHSEVYGMVLGDALSRFRQWQDELTDQQRQQVVSDVLTSLEDEE
jgi:hypothetical protein